MARPRRARVSAAYARRNERARELGYKSYYDYRAHDHGKIPPAQPRVSGARLARARGHRSSADLRRTLREGDIVAVTMLRRGANGQYTRATITLYREDGSEVEFYLQRGQLTRDQLAALVERTERAGAIVSPAKSLDVRRLLRDDDDDEPELDPEFDDDVPDE